jgi:hypothetical protein
VSFFVGSLDSFDGTSLVKRTCSKSGCTCILQDGKCPSIHAQTVKKFVWNNQITVCSLDPDDRVKLWLNNDVAEALFQKTAPDFIKLKTGQASFVESLYAVPMIFQVSAKIAEYNERSFCRLRLLGGRQKLAITGEQNEQLGIY